MCLIISFLYITYLYAVAFASATAATSAALSSLLAALPSNAPNVTDKIGKPIPKSYHVPGTPTTLFFLDYSSPSSLQAPFVYQNLISALHSVYHNALPPKTGNSFISVNSISWSSGGANIYIENHGLQESNKLTWTILADTMLGVGAFLAGEGCLQSEWTILDSVRGNIGTGYIGRNVGYAAETTSVAAVVEAA